MNKIRKISFLILITTACGRIGFENQAADDESSPLEELSTPTAAPLVQDPVCTQAGAPCSGGKCDQDLSCAVDRPSCPSTEERGCDAMLYVSGGTFDMGRAGTFAYSPVQRDISVNALYVDRHEVTVQRFRRFWSTEPTATPDTVSYPRGAHPIYGPVVQPVERELGVRCSWSAQDEPTLRYRPINCVDWFTAQAFCAWDGGRLPTEAEWEWLAGGRPLSAAQPTVPRTYPWGLAAASCAKAKYGFDQCGLHETMDVGTFPATAGLFDLAGNVWEWTADGYVDYANDCWGSVAQSNPLCLGTSGGPATVRGGGIDSPIDGAGITVFNRIPDDRRVLYYDLGFRCVRSAGDVPTS